MPRDAQERLAENPRVNGQEETDGTTGHSKERPHRALALEATPAPIVSGRAAKIPPFYERPTASNISFEEGGVFNVSKPCNRQPNPLSVSRGVRSRPMEEEVIPAKVETIPLLSPTMESELLKETSWVFPHTKVNATKEEDSAAFPAWEENFQDLSGWCMDTFQGQCDFHIGESTTFKLSGTKYEGNGILSSEEGGLKDLTSVTDEEKWNIKMNTAGLTERSDDNGHGLQSTAEPSSRYGKKENATETGASSLWLSKETATAATTASPWNKQTDTEAASTPFQSKHHIGDVELDDACPTSFDSVQSQRETWDVLRVVETTGSDTFDLLSYLCDDEMRSPEGSVSTDSSTVSKLRAVATKSSSPFLQTPVKIKSEKNETTRRRLESRTTSTITSSSLEVPLVSSRRSERTRAHTVSKVEKSYSKTKRERSSGRKRYIESDSDDRTSSSHYRESREKNNEASRKSRMNKKAKETEMAMRAIELERDNRILKMKVEELEKLVTSMRTALLRSALKKEF